MKRCLAIIALLAFSTVAGAEMYRWVGEDGSVTYKDTPPPSGKKRAKVKVYDDGDFDPAPPRQTTAERLPARKAAATHVAEKKRFDGTVELYVTSWCGYCRKAQEYLKSRQVPYVAYDIEKDAAAARRHKELGGRGVPLIVIGDKRISGFSAEALDHYLENGR